MCRSGRPAGSSTTTRPAPMMPSREPSASVTNSSNARVTGRSSNAPASIRVMSSRLVTSRASRSDCSSISSSNSSRSVGLSSRPTCRRLETAVLMEANGVRKSWEAAPMRALRQRSISSSRRARNACSDSSARSRASAAWFAKVPRRLRSRPASSTSWSTSRPTGWSPTASATETRRSSVPPVIPSERAGPPPAVRLATSLSARRSPAVAATRSTSPGARAPRPPAGRISAVQRGVKTLCTVSTMCVSSCERLRSPMSACESSYRRAVSSVRRRASSRALCSCATTWATTRTTTT